MLGSYSHADLRHIAEDLVEVLRECDDGSSFTTCQLLMLDGYDVDKFTDEELSSIDASLHHAAKVNKITFSMSVHENKVEGLPFNLDFVVLNKRAQIKCPHCGSTDTARYIYGMPVMDNWTELMLARGKWSLGGCKKEDNSPARICNACGKDFGAVPYLVDKDNEEVVDMRESVTSIRFSVNGYFGGHTSVILRQNENGALVSVQRIPDHMASNFTSAKQITLARWSRIIRVLYNQMYLNDWKKRYINTGVLDGTQWSLEIGLRGKRKRSYSGSNAYPVYWNELITLFRSFAKPYKL